MQIRDYTFSADYRVSASDSNGMLEVTPLLGVINIKLPPSETDNLKKSNKFYFN